MAGYLLLRVTGKKAVSQTDTFDLLYIFVLTNIISSPVEVESIGKALTYAVLIVILYKIFIFNEYRWSILISNGNLYFIVFYEYFPYRHPKQSCNMNIYAR